MYYKGMIRIKGKRETERQTVRERERGDHFLLAPTPVVLSSLPQDLSRHPRLPWEP